jgi:hypothetical protein
MGAASSIPPQYLLKDKMGQKTLVALCKEKKVNYKEDAEGMFLDICDENARVSRMQLSWAASKFLPNGKAGDYLVLQKTAMRDGALNALRAAAISSRQAQAAMRMAEMAAYVVPRNQASSQAAAAAAEAAYAASQTGVEATLELIDVMLRRQTLEFVQKMAMLELVQKLGETAPLVEIDLVHSHDFKVLRSGTDDEIISQISLAIKAVYNAVLDFNNRMEKAQEACDNNDDLVTFEMIHLRIEGHVERTANSKFEELLENSQRMAEQVVEQAANDGVPKAFLHPQGCGTEEPAANPSESTRLEIHIMQEGDLETYMKLRFDFYDSDCSGNLEEREIRSLAKDLGKTHGEIEDFLADMIADHHHHHGSDGGDGGGGGGGGGINSNREGGSDGEDDGFQIEASADFATLLEWCRKPAEQGSGGELGSEEGKETDLFPTDELEGAAEGAEADAA